MLRSVVRDPWTGLSFTEEDGHTLPLEVILALSFLAKIWSRTDFIGKVTLALSFLGDFYNWGLNMWRWHWHCPFWPIFITGAKIWSRTNHIMGRWHWRPLHLLGGRHFEQALRLQYWRQPGSCTCSFWWWWQLVISAMMMMRMSMNK